MQWCVCCLAKLRLNCHQLNEITRITSLKINLIIVSDLLEQSSNGVSSSEDVFCMTTVRAYLLLRRDMVLTGFTRSCENFSAHPRYGPINLDIKRFPVCIDRTLARERLDYRRLFAPIDVIVLIS